MEITGGVYVAVAVKPSRSSLVVSGDRIASVVIRPSPITTRPPTIAVRTSWLIAFSARAISSRNGRSRPSPDCVILPRRKVCHILALLERKRGGVRQA